MKLSQIRIKLKLTQLELASCLGVSRQHLSMAEINKRSLKDDARAIYFMLVNVATTMKKERFIPTPDKSERQKLQRRLSMAQIKRDQAKEKYLELINQIETFAGVKKAIRDMSLKNVSRNDKERLEHWKVLQQGSHDKVLSRLNRSMLLTREITWKTLEAEVVCLEAALNE